MLSIGNYSFCVTLNTEWASRGFRASRNFPWLSPETLTPVLTTSMLEVFILTVVSTVCLVKQASPGDMVQLHLGNMTSITSIRWEVPRLGSATSRPVVLGRISLSYCVSYGV